MYGSLKSEFKLCLIIAISYFTFWNLIVLLQTEGNFTVFLSTTRRLSIQIILISILNFLIHLYLIPKIRTKNNNWQTNIIISFGILLYLIFSPILGSYIENFSFDLKNKSSVYALSNIVRNFLVQLFGLVYFGAIKLLIDSYKLQNKNMLLSFERTQAELNYIKSQTNPHFLFNTLNNIYSLTKHNSAKASNSILRLSDLLRYMLYETEKEFSSLNNEINTIKDYLELERLRYDDTLVIDFKIDVDNDQINIPPLLLLPLIENAFKHGTSESMDKPFIKIKLSVLRNVIKLEVSNSLCENQTLYNKKDGIGLKNLKRQLELLYGVYHLDHYTKSDSFHSYLTIDLNTYAKNKLYYS